MAVKIPPLLHKMSQSAQKAWYKKNNMEMPSTSVQTGGKSAAAAKRVKVAPRKASEVKPDSVRAINAARQAAYMAKGGRAPIGAAGSGGSSVMAGSNMSTAKGIVAGIKAGFNPKVSLSPYEGMTAKEKKAMKKEEVEQVDEVSDKTLMNYSKKVVDQSRLNDLDPAKRSPEKRNKSIAGVAKAVNRLAKKGYQVGYQAEQVDEGSKRMSAAVKLQRAFDREKAASDASRKRGEEVLAQARAEYAKKQAAKTNEEVEQVDEGAKEDAAQLLGGPVKEKPKMPPGKQPAGYRYVRGLARKAMKDSMKKEEVEQVDEVDYKKYLKVSQEKRPLTPSAVDAALSAEKEGNLNPARKLRNTQDARKFANKQLTKQVAKTRPAQKFPVYEPGRKYVGDSVELDGPVIDENNLKSLKTEDTEMGYIEEKLTAADPASKWISDFVKSDNPKFAGKSKKERIQQALGAYYAAKGGKNEEVEQVDEANMRFDYEAAARPKSSDVKNFLNRDKNPRAAAASKKYIRRMTKLGGLGPNQTKKDTEAHMKANFEEVEQVDEVSQKMVRAYRDKARDDLEDAKDNRAYFKAHNDNTSYEDDKIRKRTAGIKLATKKIYGGAKVRMGEETAGKKLAKAIMAKQSKHPIAQHMGEENIVEQDDATEKKEMAETQLHFIKYAAEEILEFIKMGGEIEEWYQNKLSKVQSEVESLHSYIEGEKRRTGMVEDVVTEEGKVAVTPKEKSLAAHHGDKTKITYGDVIKARLKSAAAKKMGK